jgi:hypothetical protein
MSGDEADLIIEKRGIDYDDDNQTGIIAAIKVSCDRKFMVFEKRRSFENAFVKLKAWGIEVIKKQDAPEDKKQNAVKVLENLMSPLVHAERIELLLKLDGAA